jgi:hypothetical protein
MDSILESSFSLNPFTDFDNMGFEEFDPVEYFKTDNDFTESIMEAADGTTKKNVFQKLWSVIKKCVAWIKKKIINMANGIKKLVKGKAKPSNQILKEMGVEHHTPKTSVPGSNEPNAAVDAADSLFANFIEGFADDGMNINIAGLVAADVNEAPIKGKAIYAGGARASQVIELILDPRPIDEYIRIFKTMTDEMSKSDITAKEIDRLNNLCRDFAGRPSVLDYAGDAIKQRVRKKYEYVRVSIQDLLEFQMKVDDMCKLAEEFDNQFKALNLNLGDKGKNADLITKHYMDILNELAWVCVNLQGGLHAIANGMQGIYNIDPGYWESINDPNQLATFVEECMKTGMPGKYIVNNIYNVSDESLKGTPNVDKPIMGFGRLTLIPKGDIIYKIAINRYGVRSNKNDYRVMDAVRGKPIASMFAFTTKYYGDYTINVMEKVQAGKSNEPSAMEASKLGKKINDELQKENIGFTIYDIKADAFGKKDGRYVILDYGYLQRVTYKAQKA